MPTEVIQNECPVTVVIPVFNSERFVAAAVQSALDQRIDGMEILVVNDGSSDGTAAILDQFVSQRAVRVLRHPNNANRGVCASRRLALAESRGVFVAFLDADDRYFSGKLARHLELLRGSPDIVLAHGSVLVADSPPDGGAGPGEWFGMGENSHVYDLASSNGFLACNKICNSTVVCRRSAIPMDELPETMVLQFEDWLLWTLVSLRGRFYYDATPLTEYRLHEESFTHRQLQRPGTWELAHLELLLTLMGRLPRPEMRKRASEILVGELVSLARNRCQSAGVSRPRISGSELELEMLTAIEQTTVRRLRRLRYASTAWWRVLSKVKRAFWRRG